MSLNIGIALGDVTGIGPEVTLKALARVLPGDDSRYVVVGDRGQACEWCERLGLGLNFEKYEGRPGSDRFFIHDPSPASLGGLPPGDPRAARAALEWLRAGAELCLRGELDALVTAPVNKAAIVRAGERFAGQTEYLSALAGAERTAMMLLGRDERGRALRVVLATTHLPLRRVPEALTREGIELAIELAARACAELELPRARVAVCGLNPHAGDGGVLGSEEAEVIEPAVMAMRVRGVEVAGPISADVLFHRMMQGEFDVVVAMYHDQGLAPLKMVAFENGVNWTLGLPFVRTSPDHGTAYEIAGKGVANPSSMAAALALARQLARRKRG